MVYINGKLGKYMKLILILKGYWKNSKKDGKGILRRKDGSIKR